MHPFYCKYFEYTFQFDYCLLLCSEIICSFLGNTYLLSIYFVKYSNHSLHHFSIRSHHRLPIDGGFG